MLYIRKMYMYIQLEKCGTLVASEPIKFVNFINEFPKMVKDHQTHKVQLCQTYYIDRQTDFSSLNSSIWGSLRLHNIIMHKNQYLIFLW